MKDFRNYLLALLIVGVAFLGWTAYRQNKTVSSLKSEFSKVDSKLKETSEDLASSKNKISDLKADLAEARSNETPNILESLKTPELPNSLSSSSSTYNPETERLNLQLQQQKYDIEAIERERQQEKLEEDLERDKERQKIRMDVWYPPDD